MKRENTSQLPTSEELSIIIKKEAQRDVPSEKKDEHYVDFSLIQKAFVALNLPAKIWTENMPANEVFDIMKEVFPILIQKISTLDDKLLLSIYNYLSEEDETEESDAIFVFGAKTPARIEKAIELYHAKLAPVLFISGGNPHYDQKEKSEAEIYKEIALEKKILEEKIILEKTSLTIPDNVRSSLNLMDEKKLTFKRIILINSPYTQRRGWIHFKKYTPKEIQLIRINCSTKNEFTKTEWFKSETGIRIIINEFIKMRIAVLLNTA